MTIIVKRNNKRQAYGSDEGITKKKIIIITETKTEVTNSRLRHSGYTLINKKNYIYVYTLLCPSVQSACAHTHTQIHVVPSESVHDRNEQTTRVQMQRVFRNGDLF